jgi:hypothetical protein
VNVVGQTTEKVETCLRGDTSEGIFDSTPLDYDIRYILELLLGDMDIRKERGGARGETSAQSETDPFLLSQIMPDKDVMFIRICSHNSQLLSGSSRAILLTLASICKSGFLLDQLKLLTITAIEFCLSSSSSFKHVGFVDGPSAVGGNCGLLVPCGAGHSSRGVRRGGCGYVWNGWSGV